MAKCVIECEPVQLKVCQYLLQHWKIIAKSIVILPILTTWLLIWVDCLPLLNIAGKFVTSYHYNIVIELFICSRVSVLLGAVCCRLYELIWKSCVILTSKERRTDTRHFVTAALIWMAIGRLHCIALHRLCCVNLVLIAISTCVVFTPNVFTADVLWGNQTRVLFLCLFCVILCVEWSLENFIGTAICMMVVIPKMVSFD